MAHPVRVIKKDEIDIIRERSEEIRKAGVKVIREYRIGTETIELVKWTIDRVLIIMLILSVVIAGTGIAL